MVQGKRRPATQERRLVPRQAAVARRHRRRAATVSQLPRPRRQDRAAAGTPWLDRPVSNDPASTRGQAPCGTWPLFSYKLFIRYKSMSKPHMMMIAAGVAMAFAGVVQAAPASQLPASNPFAQVSTLPFEYPAFDKIHNEDYAPAYAEGMRLHALEIEAIANNPKAPTFDNTIVAMEKSGQLLNRVATVFGSLSGANTNDAMEALDRDLAPKLAAHNDAIRPIPSCMRASRRCTTSATSCTSTPNRSICWSATTPTSCAPAPSCRPPTRKSSRPTTPNWRSCKPPSARTC